MVHKMDRRMDGWMDGTLPKALTHKATSTTHINAHCEYLEA